MNNKRSNFRFAYVVSEIAKKLCYEKSFLVVKQCVEYQMATKSKDFFGFQVKWSPIKMLTLSW